MKSGHETDDLDGFDALKQEIVPSKKPWFVYPLLAAAVLAVSSAGPTFATLTDISPFLLSAWRLSITATLLLPFGIYQIVRLSPDEKLLLLRQSPLMLCSGVLLCLHYGAWVESIRTTSLAHALLAVSTNPLMIAVGAWILRKPISKGELIGTGVAFGGLALMSAYSGAAGSEREATVYGDLMGLVAAFVFVPYLLIGRALREWMPLFAYVLPVNITAAVTLCICAVLVEGAHFDTSLNGLFGQLWHWPYFWRCFYLAAVPGIIGHVSFNALLKWLHPLIIALPGITEAPIGELIGLLIGAASPPGLMTYIGGSILLAATVAVILSAYFREKSETEATDARIIARNTLDLELVAGLGDVPYMATSYKDEVDVGSEDEEASRLLDQKQESVV